MPIDVGTTTFEYKPFNRVKKGPIGFGFSFFRSPTYESRKNVLNEYERLLPRDDSTQEVRDAFNKLYSQHYANLQTLQILDDRLEEYQSRELKIKFTLLPEALKRKEEYSLRKESFFSNLKFHLSKEQSNQSSKSGVIFGGIFLGINVLMMAIFCLIPTIGTFLLPMPIVLFAIAIIGITTSLVLAYKDKQEASNLYDNVLNQCHLLDFERIIAADKQLETWDKINSISFDPTEPPTVLSEEKKSMDHDDNKLENEKGIQCDR